MVLNVQVISILLFGASQRNLYHFSNTYHILTMENILESCVVELENIEGIMKFRRDMSSKRLFCTGVPVSSKRCSACREGKTQQLVRHKNYDERYTKDKRNEDQLTLMAIRWW